MVLSGGFTRLHAIRDQTEVGTLSRRGKVRTPIPSITDRHSLFLSSSTRTSNSLPCGSPARGQRYGLTEFLSFYMSGLDPAYPPVAVRQRMPRCKGHNRLHTFWLKPVSNFGFLRLTVFISSSLALVVPPSLASHPPVAGRVTGVPRGTDSPPRWDYIVRELRTPPLPVMHYP